MRQADAQPLPRVSISKDIKESAVIAAFRRLSIKRKLRLVIIATSGMALLLSVFSFMINDLIEFRQSMVRELFVLADFIGISSSPGLMFKDVDTVQSSLNLLQAEQQVLFSHVYDDEGRRFASYFRHDEPAENPAVAPPSTVNARVYSTTPQRYYWFTNQYVDIVADIRFERDRVGTIYLRSDLTEFKRHLLRAGSIALGIFLLAMLLAYALSSRFVLFITTPVENLLATISDIRTVQDYSQRTPKTSEDELGDLVEGFNQMLAQIERRDSQLKEYQDHLQSMVKQRTAELEESRDQAVSAHAALQKRTEELACEREKAEAANRAKSSFLASMSHELRTPLNGILGYAQILSQDRVLTEKQLNGMTIIQRSGEYLLTLINDILDLSKIEAGKTELMPANFNFPEFIQSIADLFRMRARQKNIGFILDMPPNPPFDPAACASVPTAVYADEKRLRQILINLLGNAIKFTQQGEVRLQVGYTGAGKLQFTVKDTGTGIAPEELSTIFQPFQQAGNVLQKAKGTGLGLSISQRLVEMMGGTITVHSVPGKGSAFSFALDLPEVCLAPISRADTSQEVIGYYRLNGDGPFRLLICDDAESRLVLRNLLEPMGFIVHEALDQTECIAQTQLGRVDLIFIDLFTSNFPGMEIVESLRRLPQFHEIPVIAVSASVFASHRQKSLEAGCVDFIPKPVQRAELHRCLQKYLPLVWERAAEEPAQENAEVEGAGPSLEQAKILYELAMRGNILGIQAKLRELEQQTPESSAFCKKMNELAKEFREEEICNLIERYL